jgi:hypothetical protein
MLPKQLWSNITLYQGNHPAAYWIIFIALCHDILSDIQLSIIISMIWYIELT